MFRSHDQLIVVTSHAVAAATLRGGKTPTTVSEQSRPADADLVMAVEMALDLAETSTGKVWLALADLWSQPITIQAEVARRIPADQLPQFACFEIEPFSGISPSQGIAGVMPLPKTESDPGFWVTEIDRSTLDQIDGIIRSRGGKIAGVLHPAGLPVPIRPLTSKQNWNRLELWPEMAVCLAGRGKETRTQVLHRGAANEWVAGARVWFDAQGPADHRELWNTTGEPYDFSASVEEHWVEFSPEQKDHLRAWIEGWGRALGSKLTLPVLKTPPRPMTARDKKFATGLLAAAALLLATGHYQGMGYWNRHSGAALDGPMGALTGPTNIAKGLRKKIGEQQKELATLTTKDTELTTEIEKFRKVAAAQKRRIPELLEALSEACGPTVLVRSIVIESGRMKVHGRCIDTRQANQVVQVLARRLSELGLAISPPDKEALYRLGDGGPHNFEFFIDDQAP